MKDFRFIASFSLLAALITLIPLSMAGQSNSASPSQDDLNKLIAHASSAADHNRLADYYKNQAQQAEAAAAEHEEMLKAYAANPSTHETLKGHTPEAYCRDMVRIYKREAQLDTGLAQLHERMAKDAPQKINSSGK